MNLTPSDEEIILQKFDCFIKKCCRNEARNIRKKTNRDYQREILFSNIPNIENKFFSAEIEISDFVICGNKICIKNFLLLDALCSIDPNERELILLKYFLSYSDEEISQNLNICRRTVCSKRNKIINKLREYMEINK